MDKKVFDKMAQQEEQFFSSQFFCPVLKGRAVRLRIAGVIVTLKVRPKNFEGWGVFSPLSYKEAKFLREPSMAEKQEYMRLFPRLRLILCRRTNDVWYGIPANQADTRFKITGLVPVQLPQEVQMFEMVVCRFDGANVFYEEHDERHSPKTALYLRDALKELREPEKLECPGMTLEERDAYLMALGPALEADAEAKKDRTEERIKKALSKAGARYTSYIERDQTFTIEYTVDGQRHTSVVTKDNLEVQSAGICLAGGDRAFDLQSLVGVIREGERRRRIVRVGNNYGDHNYGPEEDQDDW